MPVDRKMKRGDSQYLYSNKIAYCKWLDRHSVTMLFSSVEGMTTTSTDPRRQKGSASKNQVSCPDLIKKYNKGIGGVDLIDQRAAAYHLDRKSTITFYLRICFDLVDVDMIHPNDLTLLYFQNHCFNLFNSKMHKSKQRTIRWQNRFQKKVSVSV